MVKMSSSSGRKRLVPTKVTKSKNSKKNAINSLSEAPVTGGSTGILDNFDLSMKESCNNCVLSGSSDKSLSADENHNHESEVVVKGHSKHSKIMKSAACNESPSTTGTSSIDWLGCHPIGFSMKEIGLGPTTMASNNINSNNIFTNGKHESRKQSSPLSLSERSGSANISTTRHKHQYHEALITLTEQNENSSSGVKDEDEDDDDDFLDKTDIHQHDPERLKAFNMFVRLFIDENLDRIIPISKQPKEKIQAIIDSCTRQFPEHAERARKRIRTYLKSCRRNKRIKDTTNGGDGSVASWESTRPTPAHLTSALAEQILAEACENESQNAKRMRMGLEPISQPHPSNNNNNNNVHSPRSSNSTPTQEKVMKFSNSLLSCSSPSIKLPSSSFISPCTPAGLMPSPCKTGATTGVAGSVNSSTCSSLSSPSSAFSDMISSSMNNSTTHNNIIGFSPLTKTNTNSAPPTINLLSNSSYSNHQNLMNGTTTTTTTSLSPILDNPSCLTNGSSMSGLSRLVGAEVSNPVVDYSRKLNGANATGISMYKPNFGQPLTKPLQFPNFFSPVTTNGIQSLVSPSPLSSPYSLDKNGDTGPTDLRMKSKSPLLSPPSNSIHSSLLTQHLSLSELTTLRQLIHGYRESAALLLRSAEELEQLSFQQQ